MFGKQCLTFYDQSHLELYHIKDVKRSGNKLLLPVFQTYLTRQSFFALYYLRIAHGNFFEKHIGNVGTNFL